MNPDVPLTLRPNHGTHNNADEIAKRWMTSRWQTITSNNKFSCIQCKQTKMVYEISLTDMRRLSNGAKAKFICNSCLPSRAQRRKMRKRKMQLKANGGKSKKQKRKGKGKCGDSRLNEKSEAAEDMIKKLSEVGDVGGGETGNSCQLNETPKVSSKLPQRQYLKEGKGTHLGGALHIVPTQVDFITVPTLVEEAHGDDKLHKNEKEALIGGSDKIVSVELVKTGRDQNLEWETHQKCNSIPNQAPKKCSNEKNAEDNAIRKNHVDETPSPAIDKLGTLNIHCLKVLCNEMGISAVGSRTSILQRLKDHVGTSDITFDLEFIEQQKACDSQAEKCSKEKNAEDNANNNHIDETPYTAVDKLNTLNIHCLKVLCNKMGISAVGSRTSILQRLKDHVGKCDNTLDLEFIEQQKVEPAGNMVINDMKSKLPNKEISTPNIVGKGNVYQGQISEKSLGDKCPQDGVNVKETQALSTSTQTASLKNSNPNARESGKLPKGPVSLGASSKAVSLDNSKRNIIKTGNTVSCVKKTWTGPIKFEILKKKDIINPSKGGLSKKTRSDIYLARIKFCLESGACFDCKLCKKSLPLSAFSKKAKTRLVSGATIKDVCRNCRLVKK